jgi:hypothetical protein
MTERSIYDLMPRPYVNEFGQGVYRLMTAFEAAIRKERRRLFPLLDWLIHEDRERYRQSLRQMDERHRSWCHARVIDREREWDCARYVAAHALGLIRIEGRAVRTTVEGLQRLAAMKRANRGAPAHDELVAF